MSRLDHWTGKIVHCHPSQLPGSHDNDCGDLDDWVNVRKMNRPVSDGPEVRVWHKADIAIVSEDVRFLGVKRKWDFGAARAAFDSERTFALARKQPAVL